MAAVLEVMVFDLAILVSTIVNFHIPLDGKSVVCYNVFIFPIRSRRFL
jgi:hypothetical protein